MASNNGSSPMIGQYKQIKSQYPSTVLMFRLGDFYEMFFDDAITVSRELDLTLTGRAAGNGERAPMCGVPYHAASAYIAKLVKKGYKVAICEQMEDPANKSDKIVAREVTRIITSGTITDTETLSSDKNNYIMSLYIDETGVGAVWADITTSETYNSFIPCPVKVKLNDLLMRVRPSEIICNGKMLAESCELSAVKYGSVTAMTQFDDDMYEYDIAYAALKSLLDERELKKLSQTPTCVCAEGALIAYVRKMQFRSQVNIGTAENYESSLYMDIDANTARTLELTDSQSKKGTSLNDVINKTCTPMGNRQLQKWIERPLLNISAISARLDAVEALYSDSIKREAIRKSLREVKDLIRISNNLALSDIKQREVFAVLSSLKAIPAIKENLSACNGLLGEINSRLTVLNDPIDLIERAIMPIDLDKDKNAVFALIKDGYNASLDEYRSLIKNSRETVAKMEAEEREKTQIKNLRISYNRLFGYYIEVPRQFDKSVPDYYTRRQTVANAERYTTVQLKELEYKIINASDLAERLEASLYSEVMASLRKSCADFTRLGKALADLDCVASLAFVAKSNGYCKPKITDDGKIDIVEGRHPVAELLPSDELFVPNSASINDDDSKIMLITGPNMAGKSLYMRQVALITVLAHIGSFVPAKSASVCLTDKIFTRVGASDDISTGRSTFMVEMSEVSFILQNATDKSLILLDEIGRGTATYDGLSIAWAVIEYLAQNFKAKVLFSTHFHELTELEGEVTGLKNYKFSAKEQDNGIKFIRKIMRGSANKSFGIEVSALAGLPLSVQNRAKQLLSKLMNADIAHKANDSRQLSMFDNVSKYDEIIKIIRELNVDEVSPRNALDILCDLKEKTQL